MDNKSRPIVFAPLREAERPVWRRPTSFSFANSISQVPLANTEILLTGHHLPIAIDYVDDRPQVVAVLDPRFQRQSAVSDDGRWRKGYMPMALRCLPFRLNGGKLLEVAVNVDDAKGPTKPLFEADGSLTPEVKQIEALLRRFEEGKRELTKAAERLLIADVLRSLQLSNAAFGNALRSYTVDRNRFCSLSHSRMAYLVKDSFLPVDLAAACIFSQRLMATLVSVKSDHGESSPVGTAIPVEIDEIFSRKIDVEVDAGELVSFDLLEGMSP
jgi:hypothetical protein